MDNNEQDCKVLSMIDFKERKGLLDSRSPLYVSHLDSKISANPYLNRDGNNNFTDRLQRIKNSLEKINFLMSELKKISDKENSDKDGRNN